MFYPVQAFRFKAMMVAQDSKEQFLMAYKRAYRQAYPYPHWILRDIFDASTIDALLELPDDHGEKDYSEGRRDINNAARRYFDPARQQAYPVVAAIAAALQSPEVVATLEEGCKTSLEGNFLRIEYTRDEPGFWLEPHTDIGVKKFTMQIYLSRDEEAVDWGTSIYDGPERLFYNTPAGSNGGLIFVPSDNSWHGYEERPMNGIRKSLIVNYVTPEWRNKHELAFPNQPVTSRL